MTSFKISGSWIKIKGLPRKSLYNDERENKWKPYAGIILKLFDNFVLFWKEERRDLRSFLEWDSRNSTLNAFSFSTLFFLCHKYFFFVTIGLDSNIWCNDNCTSFSKCCRMDIVGTTTHIRPIEHSIGKRKDNRLNISLVKLYIKTHILASWLQHSNQGVVSVTTPCSNKWTRMLWWIIVFLIFCK